MTTDVNVLVAASRSDHPRHKTARTWLTQALSGATSGQSVVLQPMVIASFLRLVTNSKIFLNPTPTATALQFIDAILGMPGVDHPPVGEEWSELRRICTVLELTTHDIPKVWLAAAVVHQGEHLVTFDGEFKRLLTRAQSTRLPAKAGI